MRIIDKVEESPAKEAGVIDDAHMPAVRARLADPKTMRMAQERSLSINRRLDKLHVNVMAIALQEERGTAQKRIWLKSIGAALEKAADGIVPCAKGCSHCCNMATFVTTAEAEEIAKATGAPLAKPAAATLSRTSNQVERAQYAGVPCSFLSDGGCTIYAHRPWACRVHYSVDQDDLLCKIVPGERIEAPSYQTQSLFLMYLLAQPGNPLDIKMADIREFFPRGLGGK